MVSIVAKYCVPVVLLLALFGVTSVASAQEEGERPTGARPRVLVTNDDGVGSAGLLSLAKELSVFADVVVSAPAANRSGASQSVTYFSTPLVVREVEIDGALRAFAVEGTPADAAHFGIMHLGKDEPFDLLISGMNRGSNVGDLSHGSGTVGAAMEGAFRRIPSIAVSVDARLRDLEAAAAFTRRFAEQWLDRGVDADVVYSINIPDRPADGWKGVRAAPMGGCYLRATSYVEISSTDTERIYRAQVSYEREFPEGSDSEAYMNGYVSITPLRFDWTHREALAELDDWELHTD